MTAVRWVLQHGYPLGGGLLAVTAIVAAFGAGRAARGKTEDTWYKSGITEGRTSGYADGYSEGFTEGYAEGRRDEQAEARRAVMPQQRRVSNGADQRPPDSTRPLPRLGNATMQFPSVRGGPS